MIDRKTVAEKIAAFLHHRIGQEELVEWAERALLEGEFEEKDAGFLARIVGRLGVADVRAFGLTWADCEDLLRQLGYTARIEISPA